MNGVKRIKKILSATTAKTHAFDKNQSWSNVAFVVEGGITDNNFLISFFGSSETTIANGVACFEMTLNNRKEDI